MSRSKKISLFIVFTLIFGVIAVFHESRFGKFIDREVYEFIYASESFLTTALFLGFTQLGEVISMIILSLIVIAILLLYRMNIHALFMVVSMLASSILIPILKHSFDRERPAFLRLIEISGFSFPSGHSLGSTIFFGSLMVIIKHTNLNHKAVLYAICAVFILLICSSRVYLGVHFPTDVLAGIAIGSATVALVSWLFHGKFNDIK